MVANPRPERLFAQTVQLQILLFVVGFRRYFANFVRGNGPMGFVGRAVLFNSNCA